MALSDKMNNLELHSDELTIFSHLHTLETQKQQLEKQIDELVEKIVADTNSLSRNSYLNALADLESEETKIFEQWINTHRELLTIKQKVRKQVTSKITESKASLASYKKLVHTTSGTYLHGNSVEDGNAWEISPSEMAVITTEKLGSGAYGSVYRGVLRGKEVAVKKFSFHKAMTERTLADLRREVSVMVKLRHPNILLFMGGCTVPGQYSIVTELMPNGSIADLLKKKGSSITFRQRLRFLKDAALGMNWLHCSDPPILHFDLKPENLLVDANFVVKVADFGLSQLKRDTEDETVTLIGSPLYMAPELYSSTTFETSCDVYSYGICMAEILSGEEPFKDSYTSLLQLKELVLSGKRPEIPANFPNKIKDLIGQCMRADYKERPTFSSILQSKVLDKAVIDSTIGAANWVAREMWENNFCGQDLVRYNDFLKVFCATIEVNVLDPLSKMCLRNVLGAEKTDTVHIEDFSRMLEYFGPMEKNNSVIQRMTGICFDLKGFWGEATTEEAQQSLSAGYSKGTYLIRFSSSDPGSYSVTVLDKKEKTFKHYRISHKAGTPYVVHGSAQGHKTLQDAISSMKELKHPCPNSKYEQMKKNFNMNFSSQVYVGYTK